VQQLMLQSLSALKARLGNQQWRRQINKTSWLYSLHPDILQLVSICVWLNLVYCSSTGDLGSIAGLTAWKFQPLLQQMVLMSLESKVHFPRPLHDASYVHMPMLSLQLFIPVITLFLLQPSS
jgi:hypothetical protein